MWLCFCFTGVNAVLGNSFSLEMERWVFTWLKSHVCLLISHFKVVYKHIFHLEACAYSIASSSDADDGVGAEELRRPD